MSSNVAVFEADIDTSKLEAGSKRAKQSFEEIGSSGTRAFDSLQAQVQTLEAKIESLEQKNQKAKGSFTQLAGAVTGLTTNLASAYFTFDNLDKVQLRVTKTQRLYEEQLAKVKKLESENKQGTQEYAFELRQLSEMKERARQAQSDLTQANFMFGLTLTTLATSTIPNSIKSIQGLNLSLQTVRTTLWTIATHPVFLAVTGFFLAWEFGISKVIEKAAGLQDGEASIVQGLQKMWEGQNKVTSDGISGFTGYTGAVEGTSSAIGSLGSGLDSVTEKTGKLVTSYSQLVEMAKGKGVSANDVAGNYNDLRKKFALDELPANDFSNFDKFLDLQNVNFLTEHDEKWNAISRAINSANISTKEYQSNLQIRIKQSGMFQDMKEYAEVIKDAHDVTRIKEFRREIQEMAKDFRLGKTEAKELMDIFDKQKKSFDLKDYELVNGKLVEITRNAHDAAIQFDNLVDALSKGSFDIGKLFGSSGYIPFSGILNTNGITEMSNTLMRSYGLMAMASEALRDGDFDGYRELIKIAKTGVNAVGSFKNALAGNNKLANFGRDALSAGKFSQDMSRITSKIGVRGTGQAGRGVSGSARARSGGGGRTRTWALQAELAQIASQKDYSMRQDKVNDLQSLASQLGISFSISNPSLPSHVMVGGRGTGMRELWLAPWQMQVSIQAQFQEQLREYQRQLAQAESQILGRVSSIGITSIGSLSSILNNPLTTNDVQAQLEFQRRLASMSS